MLLFYGLRKKHRLFYVLLCFFFEIFYRNAAVQRRFYTVHLHIIETLCEDIMMR